MQKHNNQTLWTIRNRLLSGTAAAALLAASATLAHAQSLPTGGVVVGGHAAITQPSPTQMNIIATTGRSAINWQSFSIAQGYGVNVKQPNSGSTQLENVVGNNVSQIFGSLSSNGRIVLANPNGIWFGPNAQVDVAGLVATTSYATQGDVNTFVNGGSLTLSQAGNANAAIVNQGTITIAQEGLAAFVAPGVSNQGVIQARLGTVELSSGTTPTLDFYGDGLINIAVTGQTLAQAIDPSTGKPLGAAVSNTGTVSANGGTVYITANVASGVVDQVINVSGVVQAQSVSQQNGEIVLNGGGTGTVEVAGTLDASGTGAGETGGTVKVLGNDVQLASNSVINVSGDAGGGTADIGGDFHGAGPDANATTTTVDKGATILASAITSGNGGNVAIWSAKSTSFDGTISAMGGAQSGNGGQVETSGAQLLVGGDAVVDTAAPAGQSGDWLLDPFSFGANLYINATGIAPTTDSGASALAASAVNTALSGGGAVSVETTAPTSEAGDMYVTAPITWNTGNSLTLSAWHNLVIEAPVTHSGTSATLNLDYNTCTTSCSTGLTAGRLFIFDKSVAPNIDGYVSLVAGSGGDSLYINTHPYILITDLSQITNLTSGLYALDANLGSSSAQYTTSFSDQTFGGTLEGLGHTITNLTINQSTYTIGVGLFGEISTTGVINDLGLITPSVTETSGLTAAVNIGALAGNNYGTILNSWVIGTATDPAVVSGLSSKSPNQAEEGMGGLVGTNYGTILTSFTDYVTVTGNGKGAGPGSGHIYALGGFVGSNSGTIVGSYAENASLISINNAGTGIYMAGFIGDDSTRISKTVTNMGTVAADIYFGPAAFSGSGQNITTGNFAARGTCSASDLACGTPVLSVTLQPGTKVYDGTIASDATPSISGFVGNDNNFFGLLGEAYSSPDVATTPNLMTLAASSLLINYGGGVLPNYYYTINPGSSPVDGTITPAPLTVTETKTYDGTTSFTLTNMTGSSVSGGVNGETITLTGGTSSSANAATYTGSNVTNVTWTVTGGNALASNYCVTGLMCGGSATLTINQAPLTITANDVTKTYGGTVTFTGAPSEFAVSGLLNTDTVTGATLTSAGAAPTATVAGSPYAINISSATGSGLGNYSIHYTSGSLTVNTAPLTITANDVTKTYGNTVTFTGAPSEFAVSGLLNTDTVTGATLTSAGAAPTATVTGSPYAINISSATGSGLGNYSIHYTSGSLTVNTAPLTITANDVTKTYGGTVTFTGAPSEFAVSGLLNTDTVTGATLTSAGAAPTAAVAGSPYAINISSATGSGLGNYSIHYTSGSLTVNTAPLTITANDVTKTYGGTVTFTGAPSEFAVSGLLNTDTVTGATLTSAGAAPTAAVAGSPYAINISSATGSGLSNYSIHYTSGSLTVNTAPLTITANDVTKTYGNTVTFTGAPSEFAVSGLLNTDTVTGATLTSAGAAPTAAVAGSPYAINISSATGSGLGNYSIHYTSGSLTVNTAPLTITANDVTKTYGNTVTFTGAPSEFAVSGLLNTDTVTGATLTSAGAAPTATVTGSPYAINISSATGSGLGNYSIHYTSGSLTVNTAPLTITANDVTKTYGNTVTFTGAPSEFAVSGLLNTDTVTGATLTSAGAAPTATVTGSPYAINISSATGSGLGNYSIHYTSGSLTVNTAPLTITANDVTKTYGNTVTFTGAPSEFAVSGLLNTDTVTRATLTSAGAAPTATVTGSPYAINISSATGSGLGNYSIHYTSGSLTVNTAPLTITANNETKSYGTTLVFNGTEFTSSGLLNSDTITFVLLTSTGSPASALSGTYPIDASNAQGSGLGNYLITYEPGAMTVLQQQPSPPPSSPPSSPQTLLCAADFPDCTVPHLPNPNVPLSQPGLSLLPGGNTPLAGVNPAAGAENCVNEPNELLRRECLVRQQNQLGANYGNSYLGGQAPRP